jgi:hypothetical protein
LSSLRFARFASHVSLPTPRAIPIPAKLVRCADSTAMMVSAGDRLRDHKAPRRIFIGSESHAHAARLKNTPSLAIGSLDASSAAGATQRHIDSRVSGSGTANTGDLVSGNCEEIRIAAITTASHTPDGPCATGRPNDGAYDGADGERGGAADGRGAATDGWRRLEP